MDEDTITIGTTIYAPISSVWSHWTEIEHIKNWNFVSADWHCPQAENDVRIGGWFRYTMAAQDGSAEFDLEGQYLEVMRERFLEYRLRDGREVTVSFREMGEEETEITQEFGVEGATPFEQQQAGWQAILDNFRAYVEAQYK